MPEEESTLVARLRGAAADGQWIISVRSRLQDIFDEVSLVRDVITISIEALHAQRGDFNPEMGHVLFHCAAEKLYCQLQVLSHVIGQLGGRTELTDDCGQTTQTPEQEVEHVGT